MSQYSEKVNKIKDALVVKFNASKQSDRSITVNMKVDGAKLTITPYWCVNEENNDVCTADMFTVQAETMAGYIALPCMAAMSIEELAYNIAGYCGSNRVRAVMAA